ncbi:MAG: SGNH/GDSL hydrolase family protein, partial [Planctomycetota bacterium JB042]
MKRALARLGLLLLGVLFALVLLEGALRLLSLFVGDLRGGARGRTTVLCVGDSHTYGLHVLPSDAYPSRLQGLLDPAAREVGVLNYGVPGRSSGALARELPRYLRETRPDVVLVKVGFNDSWNHDGADGTDAAR